MKVRSIMWSSVLLLILVASLPAMAQKMTEAEKKTQTEISGSPEAPQILTLDAGEIVVKTYVRTEDGSVTRGEGQYQVVPGMTVNATIPQGSLTDLLIVTFTGECSLLGASDPGDQLQIQLRTDDIVPIPPTAGITNGVAFCSEANTGSYSVQGAIRLPSGPHRIQVFWRLVDANLNDVLTGQLGHFTLSILQSQ
jgi:hypothetical protein